MQNARATRYQAIITDPVSFVAGRRHFETLSSYVLSGFFWFLGITLLCLVNGNLGPAIVGSFFMMLGILTHMLPGFSNRFVRRSFLLSFSTCVLMAGVCQSYAMSFFGGLQTTTDAVVVFYPMARDGLSGAGMEEIRTNSPLATLIAQHVYEACIRLGIDNGPFVGVLLNAFIVGISAGITCLAAKTIWGSNQYKLRLLGTLFASCGLFWVYGSLFLRDSFILLLNAFLILACVNLLVRRDFASLVTLVLVSLALIGVSPYLRDSFRIVVLGNILSVIASLLIEEGSQLKKVAIVLTILCSLFLGQSYMKNEFENSMDWFTHVSQLEKEGAEKGADEGSLGVKFIISQPLPIRIVAGSIWSMMYPVPLWIGFSFESGEYDWLVSLGGFFLVLVFPYSFSSIFSAFAGNYFRKVVRSVIIFLSLYMLIGFFGVVSTTVGIRHMAQFLPAWIILACAQDRLDIPVKRQLKTIKLIWYTAVVCVNCMWILLKFR